MPLIEAYTPQCGICLIRIPFPLVLFSDLGVWWKKTIQIRSSLLVTCVCVLSSSWDPWLVVGEAAANQRPCPACPIRRGSPSVRRAAFLSRRRPKPQKKNRIALEGIDSVELLHFLEELNIYFFNNNKKREKKQTIIVRVSRAIPESALSFFLFFSYWFLRIYISTVF